MEFEHLRINERLEYIFEDVATFSGVPKYPVVSGSWDHLSYPPL